MQSMAPDGAAAENVEGSVGSNPNTLGWTRAGEKRSANRLEKRHDPAKLRATGETRCQGHSRCKHDVGGELPRAPSLGVAELARIVVTRELLWHWCAGTVASGPVPGSRNKPRHCAARIESIGIGFFVCCAGLLELVLQADETVASSELGALCIRPRQHTTEPLVNPWFLARSGRCEPVEKAPGRKKAK